MRHSLLICTLAPPPISSSPLVAPPVLFAKRRRTQVDGAYLLLSSLEPDVVATTWMRPARQIMHYSVAETLNGKKTVSLDIKRALRRFIPPKNSENINIAQLGAAAPIVHGGRSRFQEMLAACAASPLGIRGLFEADVVAERNVISKLMLGSKAAFNASFAHGVLFLDEYHQPENFKLDIQEAKREFGFLRACTEMHTPGWSEPTGRARHTMYSVVTRSLGGLNLLLSERVDSVTPKYTHNTDCYTQLVTRPMRNGQYTIRAKTWKQWYLRAHLHGTRTMFIGLVDEAGILRDTRQLETNAIPDIIQTTTGEQEKWVPAKAARWATRVLGALRDYCQEAADGVALTRLVGRARAAAIGRGDALGAVWRVEVSSVGTEVRVIVRQLRKDELARETGGCGIVPAAIVKAYRRGEIPS